MPRRVYNQKLQKILKHKYSTGELVIWNKNLTKETDKRVLNYSKKIRKPKIKKKCPLCQKIFYVSPSRVYVNHCSYRCLHLHLWQKPEYRLKMSKIHRLIGKKKFKNKKYAQTKLSSMLKGLFKRPTSLEQEMDKIIQKNNLLYRYVGNGSFMIGYKNPDFIHLNKKICIEVHNFYHHKNNYRKKRANYFKKFGWETVFVNEDEIKDKQFITNLCQLLQ